MPVTPDLPPAPGGAFAEAVDSRGSEFNPFRNTRRYARLGRRGLLSMGVVLGAAISILYAVGGMASNRASQLMVCTAPELERESLAQALRIGPYSEALAQQCASYDGISALRAERERYDKQFRIAFAVFVLWLSVYVLYARGGRRVRGLALFGIACASAVAVWPGSPIGDVYFDLIGPLRDAVGGLMRADDWPSRWLGYTLGVGVPEELFKAVPMFVAMAITLQGSEPWRTRCKVGEPLDGVLIGAASAAGFIYAETLGQYVQMRPDALTQLELVIPRVIDAITGHIAYSAIFGYYLGLAMRYPAQRTRLMLTGLLIAAVLHGTWDSLPGDVSLATRMLLEILVGVASFLGLLLALETAREYSPDRARLVMSETGIGSEFVPAPASTPAAAPTPTPTPTPTPAPAAPAVSAADDQPLGVLETPAGALSLTRGRRVHVNEWPGLTPADGGDYVAELRPHPQQAGVYGLFNGTTVAWTVERVSDGRLLTVAPRGVVPLESAMRIRTTAGDALVRLT